MQLGAVPLKDKLPLFINETALDVAVRSVEQLKPAAAGMFKMGMLMVAAWSSMEVLEVGPGRSTEGSDS